MVRRLFSGRIWRDRHALVYKCAAGCGGKVEQPDTICFACTMDELHAKRPDNDPKEAA